MPEIGLTIGGDPSGALAAISSVQAALAGLTGKTITVSVKTDMDKALGDLGNVAKASDGAANAARDHAKAADDAARSVRDHAAASDRAAASARDHAAASDRAASSARSFAEWSKVVADTMRDAGDAARLSSSSMGQLGGSAGQASSSMHALSSGAENISRTALTASRSMSALESGTTSASRGVQALESGAASAARPIAAIEAGATSSGRAVGSMGSSFQDSGQYMVSAAGKAEQVSKALAPIDRNANNASQSMGGLGSAAGRAEQFMVGADGAAERVSKSVARMESVSMGGGWTNTSGGIGAFFGRMSQAEGAVSRFGSGLSSLGADADITGGSMKMVGMGALVGAAGIGILAAATAGIGAAGVFGDIAKSAPMMNEARKAMSGFTHAFSEMSGQTVSAGMAPLKGLAATVKSLGGELAKVGVDNMGTMLGGAATLVGDTTAAIQKLEPAIGPATKGAVALGGAVLGAFGNSAGAITSFSDNVTKNAGGIQAALEGTVSIASVAGSAVANTIGSQGGNLKTLGSGLQSLSDAQDSIVPSIMGGLSPGWQKAAGIGMQGLATAMPLEFGWMSGAASSITGAAPDTGFGTAAGSTPHDPGMAPGAFKGQSFGWHMPAGSAPLVSGQSNDTSGVVSDMSGGGGLGGGSSQQAPPSKAGAAYGAVTPGTAGPVATTAGSDAPGGAASSAPKPPPPPPAAGSSAFGGSAAEAAKQQQQPPPPPPPPASSPGATGGFGSGAPTAAATAQVQALNQALQQTAPAAVSAGAAGAQMGSQMAAGMQQAGSSAQPAAQQVTQGAQQMAQAVPQAAQAAAAPPPPPPPAAPPAPPPPPAPAAAAVAKTTAAVASSAAPAAAAGGESVGASMGSGMGVGVTKEITNTLTIVKKWIVKVISAAAGALDAHSPSRVFAALGQSIPQGLVVGMEAQAPTAVAATASMIGKVTAGATAQLASAQGQMAKAYTAAYTPPAQQQAPPPPQQQAAQQQTAAQRYPQFDPKKQQAEDQSKKTDEEKKADKKKAEELNRQQQFEANKSGLMSRGMSENSADAKAKLEQIHNDQAKKLRDRRQVDKDSAILRARGLTPGADPDANRKLADSFTNKITQRDENKDAALKTLGVRPQTPEEKANKPQTSHAKDLSDKKARSDANAVTAKETLRQGGQVGAALPQGMAGGIDQNAAGPANSADKMAGKAIDAAKKKTKTHSPSEVFHDIGKSTADGMTNGMNAGGGLAGGLGAGISDATSAIMGVASDRGLQVGYRYGTSLASGMSSVLKSDDFKAAALPQIDSPQAKAALGALGLLGPAGSGASTWKTVQVAMGGGTPAQPIQTTIQVMLDGHIVDSKIATANDALVSALLNQLKLQKT